MASVSSFKVEDGQFGHAALSFESNSSSELGGVISLTDLKSKNKTYYCKLSQHDADQIKKNGIEMNQKTVTEVISKLNKSDSNFNKTQIIQNEKTQSPCLVFVSEQVPLLII